MWQAAQAAPGRAFAVMGVPRSVVLRRQMASRADGIAGGAQLQRMRVVAVRACDALRVHPALHERAPVVDLVAHLAIVPVQVVVEQCHAMGVERRLAVHVVVRDPAGAGVAAGAGLDLAGAGSRPAALGIAGRCDGRPRHALALVQRDRQALVRGERLPVALPLCPGDVVRARPVAGLAGDVDLGPRCGERFRRRVEALAQVGRVAFGALEVPVLGDAGPVQRIAGPDLLAGIEVKPALAALRLRTRIPGDAERLLAAARKVDQVLLQRVDAEGVADLEVGSLAVGPVGVDHEPAVAAEERRGRAGVGELRVVEVSEHRALVGDLHREVVVGAAPGRLLPRVASCAGLAADVLRDGSGCRRRRRGTTGEESGAQIVPPVRRHRCSTDHRQERRRDNECRPATPDAAARRRACRRGRGSHRRRRALRTLRALLLAADHRGCCRKSGWRAKVPQPPLPPARGRPLPEPHYYR